MKGPVTRAELAALALVPAAAAGLGWLTGWAEGWHEAALLKGTWAWDALALAVVGLLAALLGIMALRGRRAAASLRRREAVENELRASEARFRAIYDNAGAGILLTLPEGSILAANAAFQRMVGYAEEDLRRLGWRKLLHPEDAAASPLPGAGGGERCLLRKEGDPMWVRLTMSYAFDDEERPFLGITVVEDVTQRRRAEEALKAAHDMLEQRVAQRTRELEDEVAERSRAEATLRESERKFRALIENAQDFITVLDGEGIVRFQSPSIQAVLGLDPRTLLGASIFDLLHPEDRARARDTFAQLIATPGATVPLQCRALQGNGSWRLLEVIAKNLLDDPVVAGVVVNSRDVTVRQEAEQAARTLQNELAHVARLSTMGEMAAGFAHELNQPLTAIQNYARGCVRRLRGGAAASEEICQAMEQTARQAHRAGEIIRRIRWFIRRDEPEMAAIDVNAAIIEAIELMESEARHSGVEITLDLAPSLPWARGDAIQIQQILINLTRNGIESMAEDRQGPRRLGIRTARTEEGDIAVAVSDTGSGIPDEVRDRLFEPFFTTKAQGLGMGLSICHSIIERHDGRLTIEKNEGGRGATVRFTLKPFEAEARPDLPPAAGKAPDGEAASPADFASH